MKSFGQGAIALEQRIEAPAESVAAYVGDFRNAKEWMVGVEGVEQLPEESYRLILESPIGKLEPEATVAPAGKGSSCIVHYTGDFRLKDRKILNRAARFIGVERFARKNGERSLLRLKHLMEARRHR